MPLETGTYISDLNASNPVGATDPKSQGDNHIRLIKSVLLNSLPNLTGAMVRTHTQLNDVGRKSDANIWTNINQWSAAAPFLQYVETAAAVDESNWALVITAGSILHRAYNDAWSSFETYMQVTRTADAIDDIRFFDTVRVRDGSALIIHDPTNADTFQWAHDGQDAVASCVNTRWMRMDIDGADFGFQVVEGLLQRFVIDKTNARVEVRDGWSLQISDADDSDSINVVHDGNEAIFTLSNAAHDFRWVAGVTDIMRTVGTTNFDLRQGLGLRIFDVSNADSLTISHDGASVDFDYVNTAGMDIRSLTDAVRIWDGAGLQVRQGGSLSVVDAGDTDSLSIMHDGTYAQISTIATDEIRIDTDLTLRDGSVFRLYDAGNTDILSLRCNGVDAVWGSAGIENMDFQSITVESFNFDAAEPGWKGTPVNVQNGNYTLVLTDAGRRIRKETGGGGETITIPANASVAFPIGTIIVIENDGGATLSAAITTDTLEMWGSGLTGTRAIADNGKLIIEKVTATLWKGSGINVS